MNSTSPTFPATEMSVTSKLLGPRMVIGSTLIDGPDPIWPGSVAVSDEAAAAQGYSPQRAQSLFARFAQNETSATPGGSAR